jgi:hypothetical protein
MVRVEDRACFTAQPGQRSGQLAVRIVDYVEENLVELAAEGDVEHE